MSTGTVEVGKSLGRAWEVFKAQPGPLILGFLVYLVIAAVGSMIPIVNILFNFVVAPPLMGGLFILALNAVSGRPATVGNVFEGFSRFGTWLGVYWLFFLITLVAAIPAGIGVGIWALTDQADWAIALIVLGGLVSLAAMIALVLMFALVYFIVADNRNDGVVDAFRKSAYLTSGNRAQIFLTWLVSAAIMLAGILACGVGILVAGPLVMCLYAVVYVELRALKGTLPGAPSQPAPGTPAIL
jgi:uncharacterized membrane protein